MKQTIKTSILIIILVMLAIFVIYTVKNFIIIKKLQNSIEQYSSSTNYSIKEISVALDQLCVVYYYEKDEKQAMIREQDISGEKTKLEIYNNGKTKNAFYESGGKKTATMNANQSTIHMDIRNNLEYLNNWKAIKESTHLRIRKAIYAGKECYVINNLLGKEAIYIEQDTGLLIGECVNEAVTMYEYEFNKIKDEVFIQPNLEDYLVMDLGQINNK